MTDKSYHALLPITVKATAAVSPYRFITITGAHCGAGAKALGVAEVSSVIGENVAVYAMGTIPVETSATVQAGDELSSDANGKAKVATTGEKINARALESAASGLLVKVMLVP